MMKAAEEKLRHIADTTSHPLVSLYAIYNSSFKKNAINYKDYYSNYLKKWTADNSEYFKKFRTELNVSKPEQSFNYKPLLVALLAFLFGFLVSKFFYSKVKDKKYKTLSIQERKIFSFLKNGKSNKEISDQLHIGLSTVKSHITNIYSKLGVKSRKDILDKDV